MYIIYFLTLTLKSSWLSIRKFHLNNFILLGFFYNHFNLYQKFFYLLDIKGNLFNSKFLYQIIKIIPVGHFSRNLHLILWWYLHPQSLRLFFLKLKFSPSFLCHLQMLCKILNQFNQLNFYSFWVRHHL